MSKREMVLTKFAVFRSLMLIETLPI